MSPPKSCWVLSAGLRSASKEAVTVSTPGMPGGIYIKPNYQILNNLENRMEVEERIRDRHEFFVPGSSKGLGGGHLSSLILIALSFRMWEILLLIRFIRLIQFT